MTSPMKTAVGVALCAALVLLTASPAEAFFGKKKKREWVPPKVGEHWEHADEWNIRIVDEETLQEMVETETLVIADIQYAECEVCAGHSKMVISMAKNFTNNISFVYVNAEEEDELAHRLNITCEKPCEHRYYRKYENVSYENVFMVDETFQPFRETYFKKFNDMLLPPATELKTEEDLAKFRKDNNVVMVGFFEKPGTDEYRHFAKAARLISSRQDKWAKTDDKGKWLKHNVVFGMAFGENLKRYHKNPMKPQVLLFSPHEENKDEYIYYDFEANKGKWDGAVTQVPGHPPEPGSGPEGSLEWWMEMETLPIMPAYRFDHRDKLKNMKLPVFHYWHDTHKHDADHPDTVKEDDAVFYKLARKYRKQMYFVRVEKDNQHLMEYFGLSREHLPAVGIATTFEWKDPHYGYHQPTDPDHEDTEHLSFEKLDAWIQDYFAGKLQKFERPQIELDEETKEELQKGYGAMRGMHGGMPGMHGMGGMRGLDL